MTSSTKWLVWFGGVVVVLVITAVILVITMSGNKDELPSADTPEGVVLRYFDALDNDDYETAYRYLSTDSLAEYEEMDSYSEWLDRNYVASDNDDKAWKVEIGDVHETDITTVVEVLITILRTDNPLSTSRSTQITMFHLGNFEEGWKITSPMYIPYQIR